MKKKSTMVFESDKAETMNSELNTIRINNQKTYRDHKVVDHHIHSRVNKFPFGSSHGPCCF